MYKRSGEIIVIGGCRQLSNCPHRLTRLHRRVLLNYGNGGADITLTIQEALTIEPLNQGSLVAGAAGADNRIQWVTIVEFLEDANLLQEGELLVTTAYHLEQDTNRRRTYVSELADRGLAGLAIMTGFYIKDVPPEMLEQAETCGFPIIKLPSSLSFSDITRSLLERIVSNQYELLKASQSVHRDLTSVALTGGDEKKIAAVLSEWTGGESLIWNSSWDVLAGEPAPQLTARIRREVEVDDPLAIREVEIQSEGESREGREGHWTHMIVPARASSHIHGYLALSKPTTERRELDKVALGHAATVYALLAVRRQAVAEESQKLKGDFLREVLDGIPRGSESSFAERAAGFGSDFSHPHCAIVFAPSVTENGILDRLADVADAVLTKGQHRFLMRRRRRDVLVLMDAGSSPDVEEAAAKIVERWGAESAPGEIRAGLGNPAPSPDLFSRSARESEEALRLGGVLDPPRALVAHRDLGIYRLVAEMEQSGVDLEAACRDSLGDLMSEEEKISRLRRTLEAYLAHDGNAQATADSLYVHRHTLRYRLKRIGQLTGRDLKKPQDRLQLHLGVVLYRYTRAPDVGTRVYQGETSSRRSPPG